MASVWGHQSAAVVPRSEKTLDDLHLSRAGDPERTLPSDQTRRWGAASPMGQGKAHLRGSRTQLEAQVQGGKGGGSPSCKFGGEVPRRSICLTEPEPPSSVISWWHLAMTEDTES